MSSSPRRLLLGMAALAALGGATGCGGSTDPNSHGGGPTALHTVGGSPMPTADEAATGFSVYFTADATDCNEPNALLAGTVSPEIYEHYSCHNVMTPSEVSKGCQRDVTSSGGPPAGSPASGTVVSPNPPRQRFARLWGSHGKCSDGSSIGDQGSYEVTVTKVKDGWIVTGFKILTGPGAGTSQ